MPALPATVCQERACGCKLWPVRPGASLKGALGKFALPGSIAGGDSLSPSSCQSLDRRPGLCPCSGSEGKAWGGSTWARCHGATHPSSLMHTSILEQWYVSLLFGTGFLFLIARDIQTPLILGHLLGVDAAQCPSTSGLGNGLTPLGPGVESKWYNKSLQQENCTAN